MHGIQENSMIMNFYKQLANLVIVNNLTLKFKVECIDIGNSIGLPYTVSCLFTYITLEIKPCGLGSRIRDVCSPKIYY